MNKEEIKTQFNKLVEEKILENVFFPEISEPTFLKVLIGSNVLEKEEDLMKTLKEIDFGKWNVFYVKNVDKIVEEKKFKNYFIIDLISSEYLDGWKRAKADFINYQNEEKERIANIIKFSNQNILSDLIVVLDSFDLGLAALEDEEIKKGFLLIKSQLEEILRKNGLEKIESKIGENYNPALEEIVEMRESNLEEGRVLKVLTAGYKLHGKVLRPARVVVSKGQINKNNN